MDVLGVLDGRSVVSLSDAELMPVFDLVDAGINGLEEIRLQLIARIEDTGYAQEVGARDAVELVSKRYRRDRAEVWRDVRLAKALPKYTAVATALADGIELPEPDDNDADGTARQGVRPMRTAQAAAIVSELERVRSRVPVEHLDVVEEQFVGLALHMSPAELRSAAREVCDLLDSDGPEPEEQIAAARESLTLTAADRGVKFKGFLANENAELLRAIVHAGARPHKTPDGEQDPRSRDKRQADALSTALSVAAAAWDTNTAATPPPTDDAMAAPTADGWANAADPQASRRGECVPGYGAKANITVTIDLDDLKTATADAIGQTVYSNGLSAAAIRRLACDAGIIPIVLGSNSEPLDVGRCERLVTRPIRRALNARDRGCIVCGAPPIMCDAHHLIHWLDGGTTAITNLALLRLSRESSGPGVG
ncbi:HNH endonuclease signature motif containing protein, partial [Kribbella jejuensis]